MKGIFSRVGRMGNMKIREEIEISNLTYVSVRSLFRKSNVQLYI